MIITVFKTLHREVPHFLIIAVPMTFMAGLFEGVGAALILPALQAFDTSKEIAPPKYMAFVTEFLGLPSDVTALIALITGVVVIKAVIMFAQRLYTHWVAIGYERRIKGDVFSLVFSAGWQSSQNTTAGEVINTLTVEAQRARQLIVEFSAGAAILLFVIAYSWVAVELAWKSYVFSAMLGVFVLSLFATVNKKVRKIGERLTDLNYKSQNFASDAMGARKYVISTSATRQTVDVYENLLWRVARNWRSYQIYESLARASREPIVLFIILSVAYFHISTGQDLSSFLALGIVLFRLYGRVTSLVVYGQILNNLFPSFAAVDRTRRDLRAIKERTGGVEYSSLKRGIVLDNIEFFYDVDRVVLRDCSVEFEKGKITALIGPSGSGKSTMIDIVLGLVGPQAGTVSIDDNSLDDIDLASYRRHIGIVPQDPVLFNDTIVNNIKLHRPDADQATVERAAKLAFAHEFTLDLPQGYETVVGERGAKLSGGQRQRIALARALINEPDLLILDEATSALDDESELRIKHAIDNLRGKLTIIIIAHRPTTIEHADVVYRLSDGRAIRVDGTDAGARAAVE